jgi:4-amino-4-deoxy-L-arabinose transferase-like glycosyltransferase
MVHGRNMIYYILFLALFLRLYGIFLLNLGEWDEQFHALVAKNLMENPLRPSLVTDNLVWLDINDWSLCNIWLSKPPMAFWPMAISMKIFGVNEFGLRFPSLVFSLLTIYLAYIIARKLFNEKIGIITAFFYAINGILYEINVGHLSGDHVDTLLHLLFHLSIYVVLFKIEKPSIAIGSILGVVIGLAFLTKWIMAFFIFFVCFSYFVYIKRDLFEIIKFTLSVFVTFLVIVTPWLFWIYNNFPDETILIMKGIIFPISNVVQEHTGPWYYYLNSIRININELVYLPFLFFIYKTMKRPTKQRFLVLAWILIPLILLSISTTKRSAYILMSATPFFIMISLFITYLNQFRFEYKKSIYFIQILFFIFAIRYSLERVKPLKNRFEKPDYRHEMEALINTTDLPSDSLVLVNEPDFIKARFYYGLLGYRYLNDSIINDIRSKGFKVFNNVKGKYVLVE